MRVPFGDGVRCIGGGMVRLPLVRTDGLRGASSALDLSRPYLQAPITQAPITLGTSWNFQLWYPDRSAGDSGFNLSGALEARFCP